MGSNEVSRKDFLLLTFTLVGTAAVGAGCGTDSAGSPTGAGGTGGPVTCDSPLPSTQTSDGTGHTHTVSIPSTVLASTTPQSFTTSSASGHTHTVTLSVNTLSTLRGGGSQTVNSSSNDNHTHAYHVSCQA